MPLLAPDLRMAVDLVLSTYADRAAPMRCVVRPEIFTHGKALDWLREKLGDVTDHINISDGTTIKLIPGVRNHLFTYGLHSHRRHLDFKKLMRRAPELLGQCQSQLNSFHRIVSQGLAVEPAATLILPATPVPATTVWFYGFYLNPHSCEDSAEHMLNWGEFEGPKLVDFDRVTYIPLTESAARDASFQRLVAETIANTYFDPKSCLLIRLPLAGTELTARMRVGLEGIRTAGLNLPQARSKNIFLLGEDLSEDSLASLESRLSFVLHQTFEYWRYTRSLYQAADKIIVFLDQDWRRPSETAKRLLRDAFGQTPRFTLGLRPPEGEWTADPP